jgi:hypothetical protein
MAFALKVAQLEDALKLRGCPICRMGHQSAVKGMESFVYEYVNDQGARQPALDALGFCKDHTRLFVAGELASSATVLGVNIVYDHLSKLVYRELRDLKGKFNKPTGWFRRRGKPNHRRVLSVKGRCPLCIRQESSEEYALVTLLEILEAPSSSLRPIYPAGDGICLNHLRTALEQMGDTYPAAAQYLLEDATARLERLSEHMQGYIHKNQWENQGLKLGENESQAWRLAMTFFTGLPGDHFNHKIDEF